MNQLPPEEKLLPPNGVYVTETVIGEKRYRGITNVGCKPTVGEKNPIGVETHLFDFEEDVYGRTVTVEFLASVRSERRFSSVEELKSQLEKNPIGVETHLFDFEEDVYGRTVTVEFLASVRSERRFSSVEELKSQLQRDIVCGRTFFENVT